MRYLTHILLAISLLAGVRARAATEINYWLWDNNQLPSYQACAEAFEKKNPDVVRILRANFDAIFLEGADVTGTLKATNKEVNALFE